MSSEPVSVRASIIWSRVRSLLRHPVSTAGVALSLVSLANIFLFVLIDFIAQRSSPYIGILAYIVAPGFLVCGLLLCAIGVWQGRAQRTAESPAQIRPYPRIDFNDPGQRGAAISFIVFLIVFVILSSVGSYKAYEFTD